MPIWQNGTGTYSITQLMAWLPVGKKNEEKILHKHNLMILSQLYQTEVLFRSHDQMGRQGIDKVQQRMTRLADSRDLRILFKYFNAVRKASPIPPKVTHDNVSASTPDEQADLFNAYFQSVFSANRCVDVSNVPDDHAPQISIENFDHYLETKADISSKLDTTKLWGPDNLPPVLPPVLLICKEFVLQDCTNCCISTRLEGQQSHPNLQRL